MIDMIELLVLFTEWEGAYAIQVRSPDVGETPQPAPRVEGAELERIGKELLEARRGNLDEARVARLGKALFSKVFQAANFTLYCSARTISGKCSRPIRLRLALATRSPLQRIPWELLHDGTGFLSRDLRCAVVRTMEGENPVHAVALHPPVRILVTAACPNHLPKLDLDSEIKGIHAAYEKHRRVIVFRYYDQTSLEDLQVLLHDAVLAGEPFHVWHHCGHGGPTDASQTGEYRLLLEKGNASISDIVGIIRKCIDLRVVILNVCSGASSAGLAPELAQINVPSVLSFSSKVRDKRAGLFALALHRGLLALPIEVAADIARESMCRPDLASWEWSQILHFSRRSDSGPLLALSPRPARKKTRIEKIYDSIKEECRQASK